MINFKEKRLLLVFAFLILLILLIGLFGITQIQGLSRKIEGLGGNNLKLESAVLEMRRNSAIFAMGIRNYVFWRVSQQLSVTRMAAKIGVAIEAGENFKYQLGAYRQNAYLNQQKEWAGQVAILFDEVFLLGKKIVQATDIESSKIITEAANSRLISFENRIYKIDEFLSDFMSKSNLEEVQRQLFLAKQDKERAIFFLEVNLLSALILGILTAFLTYRKRIQERSYRQRIFNHMVNVEEAERKNLSAAVHDEMGQDLSALKIYLGLIDQGLDSDDEGIKDKIERCKKITFGLLEKSHNIAFLLRPPDLDEVGLLESIEALLLESSRLSGVEYTFRKPPARLELVPEYSLLIYRIVQELLTNMVKHARAKNVEIAIDRNGGSLKLFYADNGQGFDCSQALEKFLKRKEDKFRFGLIGLKERVEVLDGVMQINSSCGKGMSVTVLLPLR